MLWIMVLGAACVVLGIFNAVWGFVEALMLRRARRAPAKAEGVVCGLVRHRLPMRYEKQGDVPKVAYQSGAALQPTVHMAFSVSRRR